MSEYEPWNDETGNGWKGETDKPIAATESQMRRMAWLLTAAFTLTMLTGACGGVCIGMMLDREEHVFAAAMVAVLSITIYRVSACIGASADRGSGNGA